MRQDLKIRFYSTVKEEDAEPFAADGLLAVADGLGGSGSTVHVLSDGFYQKKNHPAFRKEILKRALPEYDESKHSRLSPHIDCWLDPMADEIPDTSALWGSRITLARLVFALYEKDGYLENLDVDEVRDSLSEFIRKGLTETAVKLKLKAGYGNQRLLPSTLAALAYYEDDNGIISAEVVWAGDSRCYAWSKNGLLQLSDDDACAGLITNLFSADGPVAVLHYRRFDLTAPCVLLAVTDGAFPSGDSDGLFGVLTAALKDADSPQAFATALQRHYDQTKLDDASGALAPVGFGSFQAMKEELLPKKNPQQFERVASFVSDPANCQAVLSEVLAEKAPSQTALPLLRAYEEFKKAAVALSEARASSDGHLRVQRGIGEAERVFLGTVSKRREENRKDYDKIALEKARNSETQKDLYHVKMKRLEKKIRFLQNELGKLNERYRQNCNPRGCPNCDPRCLRYLSLPGQITTEIKELLNEQRAYIADYNALKDRYLKLHSDLSRLDNQKQELEREDRELEQLLSDFEAGLPISPEMFQSGSAKVFAGRINTVGDREAVSKNIAGAETIVSEKAALYKAAANVFFAHKTELIKNLSK